MTRGDLITKYSKVDGAKIKKDWLLDFRDAERYCRHGPNVRATRARAWALRARARAPASLPRAQCKNAKWCEIGKRVTHTTILTGALVEVWSAFGRRGSLFALCDRLRPLTCLTQ